MDAEIINGEDFVLEIPDLKSFGDFDEHALPFIFTAAATGISIIEKQKDTVDKELVLTRIVSILTDIQRVLKKGTVTSEMPLRVSCDECSQWYYTDPGKYYSCMHNCTK